MFGENGSLPITGGAVLAVALYAGVSLFVTGPLIGGRMVEKMDWAGQCAGQIRAEVEAREPEASATLPRLGCEIFGVWHGEAGMSFCAKHGHVFEDNPVNRTIERLERAKREAQQKRMDYAASRAASRCDCAVTTTLENRRVSFAIYAGTARLVSPPSIIALGSDLATSLNTPACAMKG
jgi:hypothetical protein